MKAEYPSLWTIPDDGVVDESWRFDKIILLTKVASIRVTGTQYLPLYAMPYLAQLTAFGQLETQD
jgi:hypothetical protein